MVELRQSEPKIEPGLFQPGRRHTDSVVVAELNFSTVPFCLRLSNNFWGFAGEFVSIAAIVSLVLE